MRMACALVTAEGIKLRRSAAMRLAWAAPALLFVLELLTMFARGQMNATDPKVLWRELLSFGWILWLGLFTPALITFEAICLAGLEHGGRQWKQLFAMPVPRWGIFAVKMLACAALVGGSFAAFTASSAGAVLMFSAARGLGLAAATPWLGIVATAAKAYAACWLLIVVHTWLSVRFPGFAVPAGIAFAAVLAGYLMLSANPRAFGWWYPWTLAISVRPEGLYEAHYPLLPVLVGGLGGLLLAPVAAWDLGRRID